MPTIETFRRYIPLIPHGNVTMWVWFPHKMHLVAHRVDGTTILADHFCTPKVIAASIAAGSMVEVADAE